jgi:release factor glutamine methyltransferase
MSAAAVAMTLAERLSKARADLMAAGVHEAEASVDVDVYAREILGWDRARLLLEQRSQVPTALEPRFSEWVARRTLREPTAYIVGRREFWNLSFRVSPAVLIPRPETELIVEEALVILRAMTDPRVADIGTGSGCLAVAIAYNAPGCTVVATDVSQGALDVAVDNARDHGVSDRIRFACTSYLDGIEDQFDLIVANPPYVKHGDRAALGKTVRHEPDVALFGGMDGLRDIAGVLDAGVASLAPGGWFLVEFGYGQEEAVRRLVGERRGLTLLRVREDLQGIPRTAVLRRD